MVITSIINNNHVIQFSIIWNNSDTVDGAMHPKTVSFRVVLEDGVIIEGFDLKGDVRMHKVE